MSDPFATASEYLTSEFYAGKPALEKLMLS